MVVTIHLSPELEALVREVLMARRPKERPSRAQEAPEEVPEALACLDLYKVDQRLCKAWEGLLDGWLSAFPGLDVLREVRQAHAWELANPKCRKSDRPRFLHTWMQRSNDRPRKADPLDVLAANLGRNGGGSTDVFDNTHGLLSNHPW